MTPQLLRTCLGRSYHFPGYVPYMTFCLLQTQLEFKLITPTFLRIHDFFSQGLNVLIPVLDRIRYVQSLKEIVINVPEQSAVTLGERHR